jgi:excisionase family DNA binding protein
MTAEGLQAERLLTVGEVAEWLRVKPRYVYRLASSGALDRVYLGRYLRIPAASVSAYIAANTAEAQEPKSRPRRRRPGARRHLRMVGDGQR